MKHDSRESMFYSEWAYMSHALILSPVPFSHVTCYMLLGERLFSGQTSTFSRSLIDFMNMNENNKDAEHYTGHI